MTIGIPHETRKQQNDRVSKQAAAHQLILAFFAGDEKKTIAWFTTPNPLLGNMDPLDLIRMGQADKVLRFVKTQLAQNEPPVARGSEVMTMTDAEATLYLENLVSLQVSTVDGRGAALLHALQAMTDREALADIAEELASSEPDMPSHVDTEQRFDSTLESVRKHMRGEE